MNQKLSASIVLYNTPLDQLKSCLESLKKVSLPVHLWLIDNSPSDDLREAQSILPNTIYKNFPDNLGFGSGHNIAIREAQKGDFDYHLIVNADIYFDKDVLTPMLNYMEERPSVGHMMPKVLNLDGSLQRLCRLVPSPVDLFTRRFLNPSFQEK